MELLCSIRAHTCTFSGDSIVFIGFFVASFCNSFIYMELHVWTCTVFSVVNIMGNISYLCALTISRFALAFCTKARRCACMYFHVSPHLHSRVWCAHTAIRPSWKTSTLQNTYIVTSYLSTDIVNLLIEEDEAIFCVGTEVMRLRISYIKLEILQMCLYSNILTSLFLHLLLICLNFYTLYWVHTPMFALFAFWLIFSTLYVSVIQLPLYARCYNGDNSVGLHLRI